MNPPAVAVSALAKSYRGRRALGGVSMDIAAGELFALLGPNGSGKSTLFRILATVSLPDAGSATIGGHDVVSDAPAVRRLIGVVFQSPSLDPQLTVRENLVCAGALYGMRGKLLGGRIGELTASLRLGDLVALPVRTLSGGQQRRVEIAKCLLPRPRVLLLDEPSTGLDPAARSDFWALIASLRSSEKLTVLFTSHLMDESARADRVAILDRGGLVAVERPEVLLAAAGPEVLRVSTPHPREVAALLRAQCALDPRELDSEVRVSTGDAHAAARLLESSLPGSIDSCTIAKPTLEDVFLFLTGHTLSA